MGSFYTFIGIMLTLLIIIAAIEQLQKEVKRTNFILDRIAKQTGVPNTVSENLDIELKSLIFKGKRVNAIKRYKKVTGLSLAEAKIYVDFLGKQEV